MALHVLTGSCRLDVDGTSEFRVGRGSDKTIKLECLSKFIIFGKGRLDHLLVEFTEYYNHHRSHLSRDHLPPVRAKPAEVAKLSIEQVEVKSYVGGLVKAFEKAA